MIISVRQGCVVMGGEKGYLVEGGPYIVVLQMSLDGFTVRPGGGFPVVDGHWLDAVGVGPLRVRKGGHSGVSVRGRGIVCGRRDGGGGLGGGNIVAGLGGGGGGQGGNVCRAVRGGLSRAN